MLLRRNSMRYQGMEAHDRQFSKLRPFQVSFNGL
jgi:hypothetical protein